MSQNTDCGFVVQLVCDVWTQTDLGQEGLCGQDVAQHSPSWWRRVEA